MYTLPRSSVLTVAITTKISLYAIVLPSLISGSYSLTNKDGKTSLFLGKYFAWKEGGNLNKYVKMF